MRNEHAYKQNNKTQRLEKITPNRAPIDTLHFRKKWVFGSYFCLILK